MKKLFAGLFIIVIILIIWFFISYNGLVSKEENVNQQWAQVEATYQRRLDLIPNLVATVKGYAEHEKSTLLDVTNARSKAYETPSNNVLNNPDAFSQYTRNQAALGSALNKLLVVVEKYPDLKASQNFLALQSQLEGTENRINVARQRFNEAVKVYNTAIRLFPGNIVASIVDFQAKPFYQAEPQAAQAPNVSF